ncbi:MAG: STAS domain-containing protein [Planctomycetota bacterium]
MPLQKWSDQIWVSQMSEAPSFSEDIEVLKNQYAAAEEPPHVVIDLSQVRVLNSSNISQMLQIRKLTTDNDRRLRVAAPQDAVWSVFLTAGLDKVFEFSQDTSIALAELQLGG